MSPRVIGHAHSNVHSLKDLYHILIHSCSNEHSMVYVVTSMWEVGDEKFEICFSGKTEAKF